MRKKRMIITTEQSTLHNAFTARQKMQLKEHLAVSAFPQNYVYTEIPDSAPGQLIA